MGYKRAECLKDYALKLLFIALCIDGIISTHPLYFYLQFPYIFFNTIKKIEFFRKLLISVARLKCLKIAKAFVGNSGKKFSLKFLQSRCFP